MSQIMSKLAEQPTVYGTLEIRERVVVTPDTTIALRNISRVACGRVENPLRQRLILGAVIASGLGSVGLLAPVSGSSIWHVAVFWAVSIVFAILGLLQRKKYHLTLFTNDGARTAFTGPDVKLLDEVRSAITRKIDTDDTRLTLVANFEKGVIEHLRVAELKADTVVAGDNNMVATNSPGARVGTADTTRTTHTANHYSATNAPGAQVGPGNVMVGSSISAHVVMVDYSAVLPEIERWRASAAGSPGWEHVAERLARLEALLRDGTPTADQKQVARGLAIDLSQILQGYPAAVQLFQGVLRLIGV